MGRKVHPIGFRLGIIRDWQATWYADKHYADFLHEDLQLRQAIRSRYAEAGVSQVQIDRQANEVSVTIYTARPGVVIGRGGQRVDEMRLHLEHLIGKRVRLNIQEIRQPELDAYLVAKAVADQIEHRVAYRRAMKQAIFRTIQAGAKGVKVSCSGRLAGAEIARRQTMHQGQVPLHTLRADIDYGLTEARTTLGRIGVKVWIYKGDILPEPKLLEVEEMPAEVAVGKGAEVELPTVAEPVTTPEELVAAESVKTVAEEEKPAKRATRISKKEPVAAESVKTVAEEKKPAKRATRISKKAPPAAELENITQPAVDITTETEASTPMEKEEKDVTT